MAMIMRVDGTEEELTDTSLESLQKAVGGYIEIYRIDAERLMVMDDEGRLKGRSTNKKATTLMSHRGLGLIVGDVVVVSNSEMDEEDDEGN